MACNPKCPYFPKIELGMSYKTDLFGVKRKIKTLSKPMCMYDLSILDDWDKKCPRLEATNKIILNAKRG